MTDLAQRILAEIDRRLAVLRAATPGPWTEWESPDPFCDGWRGLMQVHGGCVATLESQLDDVDAIFIAASRNEREGELMAVRGQVEALDDDYCGLPVGVCAQVRAGDRLRAIARHMGIEEGE